MRALRRAVAAAVLLGIPAWTVAGASLAVAADPAGMAAPPSGTAPLALIGAGLAGMGLWRRWRAPAHISL